MVRCRCRACQWLASPSHSHVGRIPYLEHATSPTPLQNAKSMLVAISCGVVAFKRLGRAVKLDSDCVPEALDRFTCVSAAV